MFHISAPQDCKVALIAGGTSGEREISLASKEGALTALNEAGYQVEWLDPAKEEDIKTLVTGSFYVAFLALH